MSKTDLIKYSEASSEGPIPICSHYDTGKGALSDNDDRQIVRRGRADNKG